MPLAIIRFMDPPEEEEMQRIAVDVTQGIREYLAGNLKHRSGDLEESIKSVAYGREIVVESDLPYAKSLDRGSKTSNVMWHLINKVVPLKLRDGRTIFRAMTMDGVRRGKWRTKPRMGVDFIGRGVEIARSKTSLRSFQNFIVAKP